MTNGIKYSGCVALTGLLGALLLNTGAAQAGNATIIGIYEDCQPISSTIVMDARSGDVDPAQLDRIAAQAEAEGIGIDFDQALPLMIATLQEYGVENINVQKQGACGTAGHGKFVEAVIGYCGEQFDSAEVRVDGDIFYKHQGDSLDFDSFVSTAREKLKTIGVFDDPRVSLTNSADCQTEVSS